MWRWWQIAWEDFKASIEPEEIVSVSSPAAIALGPGALFSALLVFGYVPPLANLTGLRDAWISALLVFVGSCLTFTAYKTAGRKTIGTVCTLLDNAFYSTALAFAAANSREAVGMALAVVHVLMVALAPARVYGLTALFGVVVVTPVVLVLAVARPTLPVGIVLVASTTMALVVSQFTADQRRSKERQKRLEEALGAADRLADESVQTALTTTLLTLGHFLHELRNYQTAIATNLEYVAKAAELPRGAMHALDDARIAQERQADLVRSTIEGLKARSAPEHRALELREVLTSAASTDDVAVAASGDLDFEIVANPEHLRVVLLNLVRNAAQAGARQIQCDARVEPSGTAVLLSIEDDGPGIPENRRANLFDAFSVTDKPDGSGLGLYLVRRHVELLGGSIAVSDGARGGAAFAIRLPGRRAKA